ncbi:hypothetical protein [Blastomonas sp.]|uniref:hypothetical protein n=1 Tax=Blastomonas sp. TaxID=1909299 RepID=UPI003918E600
MSNILEVLVNKWRGIVTYTPLVVGLILLFYLRDQGSIEGNSVLSIALLLMACSCLVYSVLPGAGQISSEQELTLNQLKIRYSPWMGRVGNAAIGLILIAASVTLFIT